jgi:hypothetical protein
VALLVALRAAIAQPAGDRDLHHAGLPGAGARRIIPRAVYQ